MKTYQEVADEVCENLAGSFEAGEVTLAETHKIIAIKYAQESLDNYETDLLNQGIVYSGSESSVKLGIKIHKANLK